MNGTLISDAELKSVLLALAKAGAPTPKRGTVLGDALARFTTPDCDGAAAHDSLAACLDAVRPFAVTVSLTRVTCGTIHVAATNEEKAEAIVRDAADGLDFDGPSTQYIKTEHGVKEFHVDFCDCHDTDVDIEDVQPLDPDDCTIDLTESE